MVAVDTMEAQQQLLRAELEGKQRHLVSLQAEVASARRQGLTVAQAIQDNVSKYELLSCLHLNSRVLAMNRASN